jgi:hypothetical protein
VAKGPKAPPKENLKAIQAGWQIVNAHTLFSGLSGLVAVANPGTELPFPKDGFARLVVSEGPKAYGLSAPAFAYRFTVVANAWKRATPQERANVLGQVLLHVAMAHVDPVRTDLAWRHACELMATDLLRHLGLGQRPSELPYLALPMPARTLEGIANVIETEGACGLRWPRNCRCASANLDLPGARPSV